MDSERGRVEGGEELRRDKDGFRAFLCAFIWGEVEICYVWTRSREDGESLMRARMDWVAALGRFGTGLILGLLASLA